MQIYIFWNSTIFSLLGTQPPPRVFVTKQVSPNRKKLSSRAGKVNFLVPHDEFVKSPRWQNPNGHLQIPGIFFTRFDGDDRDFRVLAEMADRCRAYEEDLFLLGDFCLGRDLRGLAGYCLKCSWGACGSCSKCSRFFSLTPSNGNSASGADQSGGTKV